MKKSSGNNLASTSRDAAVPEPSSSDFELEDSMMIQSDEGEVLSSDDQQQHPLSPNTTIDESMILSDEEEDIQQQQRIQYEDDVDDQQRQAFVSDDDDDPNNLGGSGSGGGGKPPAKKIWTGRTKRNYANPQNSATTALLVEDKPWRSRTSSHNNNNNNNKQKPISTGDQSAPSPPTPKSPSGRHMKQTVSSSYTAAAATPPLYSTSSPSENKKGVLKYIRGLANPQPSPRGGKAASSTPTSTSRGNADGSGDWSDDDEEDDNSSVSSEMISYSSIDSMGDSEDELSLPCEDYFHHPESEEGFWSQMPFMPSNFVHNVPNTTEMPSLVLDSTEDLATSHAMVTGALLPYLDPELKDIIAMSDASEADDFHFVLDHRFFLRALCQLLAERDEVGVEASIHDESNIIKKGPLKKKYLGMVKVKYVELRRGNLVYYGDDDGEGRKTIHLRSATASCTAIDSSAESDVASSKTGGSTSPSHNKATVSGTSHEKTSSHGGGSGHTTSLSAGLTSAINAATTAASSTAAGSSYAPGYEFHLWVEGKRYSWLASSKNEQQSWVKAIRGAMIGDIINDDDWGMTLGNAEDGWARHEEALEAYKMLQSQLSNAANSRAYLDYILPLLQHPNTPTESPALQIPLKWVSEQYRRIHPDIKKDGCTPQKRLKTSIAEFWNNMERFDFAINGHVINRESPFAAERIIGSLARCILDFDRYFLGDANSDELGMPSLKEVPGQTGQSAHEREKQQHCRPDADRISELDAVSYARNVLMMIIKSKTSGDVEFAVDYLCQNEGLVRIDPVTPSTMSTMSPSPETLHIDVSFAGDDVVDHHDEVPETNEVSGWVMIRRSKYNSWKTRFCVFSEGVFSYYENAKPRPHGLRGQLVLAGAALSMVDEKDKSREDSGLYILRLATKSGERERQFGFKKKEEFLFWKESIESVIEASVSSRSVHSRTNSGTDEVLVTEEESKEVTRRDSHNKKSIGIIEGGTKLISYATDGGIKAVKGAAGGGMKVVKGAAGGGMKVVKGAAGGGMKVVKGGTKVIKGATGGGMKAIKGATDLMFRSIRSKPKRDRTLRKSPSLQVLMENSRSEKTGKKEPTVQCVIQTTSDFRLRLAESGDNKLEDVWTTVRVKFLQAYLLSGGSSGRLARGDAMIEMEFIDEGTETEGVYDEEGVYVDEDDNYFL